MNAPVNKFALQRNDANARKIGGSGRVQTTGAYEGVFTRAEAKESSSGALGIEFDFKTNDGATASFLGVWYLNGDGKELSGMKIVDALQLLLRVKSTVPVMGMVEKWDSATREVKNQKLLVYPDFMGKPIGLLLQVEHDVYNGQPTQKMIIYGMYDIASGKTPMEIVDKKPAGGLAGQIAALKDKPYRPKAGAATPAHHGSHAGARPATPFFTPFLDDDIPY